MPFYLRGHRGIEMDFETKTGFASDRCNPAQNFFFFVWANFVTYSSVCRVMITP